MPDLSLVLVGLGVGTLVGLTGMGGGALLTPLLVLGFNVPPTAAVGSDLVVSLAVKPVGAFVHQRAGRVRWDLVALLLPTALPAAFAGAYLESLLGTGATVQARLQTAIGAALLLGVAGMVVQAIIARRRGPAAPGSTPPPALIRSRPLLTLMVGLLGGAIVGLTSVGSGSIIIVGLLLVYPHLSAKELVGTDLAQAVPLVAVAALGHVLFGEVRVHLALPLIVGALPGVVIGARLAGRLPGQVIRWILAVILTGTGLRMLGVPGAVLAAVVAVVAVVALVVGMKIRRGNGGQPGRFTRQVTKW